MAEEKDPKERVSVNKEDIKNAAIAKLVKYDPNSLWTLFPASVKMGSAAKTYKDPKWKRPYFSASYYWKATITPPELREQCPNRFVIICEEVNADKPGRVQRPSKLRFSSDGKARTSTEWLLAIIPQTWVSPRSEKFLFPVKGAFKVAGTDKAIDWCNYDDPNIEAHFRKFMFAEVKHTHWAEFTFVAVYGACEYTANSALNDCIRLMTIL